MKTYKLSYATVNILHANIVEVICDEGIELTVEMLKELESLVDEKINVPFKLLINRKNTYSYSFEALQYFEEQHDIVAAAFVTYSKTSKSITDYAINFMASQKWEAAVFENYELAIDWLNSIN